MSDEQKKFTLNFVAYLSLILWVANILFQAGTIYASSSFKSYADQKKLLNLCWRRKHLEKWEKEEVHKI